MIPFKQEKLENAICYFIHKHEGKVHKKAYKTFIFKYISLFDFLALKESGRPALDIEYYAYDKGPVPESLYNRPDSIQSDLFHIVADGNGNHYYEADSEPEMDYFSQFEKDVLDSIVEKYMKHHMRTDYIIEVTHQLISAWKTAWNKSDDDRIQMYYDDTFQGIYDKEEDELTAQEDSFLLYKASLRV